MSETCETLFYLIFNGAKLIVVNGMCKYMMSLKRVSVIANLLHIISRLEFFGIDCEEITMQYK